MKRALVALLVALAVVACAPKLEADLPDAVGVTTSVTTVDAGVLYRVDVDPPLDRLVLLFLGENLAANASECAATPTEISCVVRPVPSFYEITIAGSVAFAEGIAQRGSDYAVVRFAPALRP